MLLFNFLKEELFTLCFQLTLISLIVYLELIAEEIKLLYALKFIVVGKSLVEREKNPLMRIIDIIDLKDSRLDTVLSLR